MRRLFDAETVDGKTEHRSSMRQSCCRFEPPDYIPPWSPFRVSHQAKIKLTRNKTRSSGALGRKAKSRLGSPDYFAGDGQTLNIVLLIEAKKSGMVEKGGI